MNRSEAVAFYAALLGLILIGTMWLWGGALSSITAGFMKLISELAARRLSAWWIPSSGRRVMYMFIEKRNSTPILIIVKFVN